MSDQISLFELAPVEAEDPSIAALAAVHADARAIASQLPDDLRFGTSSWRFQGWKGIVYSGTVSSSSIAKGGLHQYASHPLLRTVGVDRSYYAPIPIEDLRRYADQLPDGFRCCTKAPAGVTAVALTMSLVLAFALPLLLARGELAVTPVHAFGVLLLTIGSLFVSSRCDSPFRRWPGRPLPSS